MTAYLYDAATSPDLAQCKRHNAIAVSWYMVGPYSGSSPQPGAAHRVGLGALLNWERMAGALVWASRSQGRAIGREALRAVPAGCPRDGSVAIYFSIDLDVQQLASCDEALRGINDVLHPQFQVRVYAEGALIDRYVRSGLVQGKQWLSMSESFPGFNVHSPNVALVQMHDAQGNWIGTDIGNTDRNTVLDPHGLAAWWPPGSPFASTTTGDEAEEMALSKQAEAQVTQIVAAQFSRFFATLGADGKLHDHSALSLMNQSTAAHAAVAAQETASAALARVAQLQAANAALSKKLDALTKAGPAGDVHVTPVTVPVTGTLTVGGTK